MKTDPRFWTDDEVFADNCGGFRADTEDKRNLVARIKKRMAEFAGKSPQTDEEKVDEIVALYIAIMEESDYPERMQRLVDLGAMKNGMLQEDDEVDEAYEKLRDEIDTMAQLYFYRKRLRVDRNFALLLFSDLKLDRYSTQYEVVEPRIRQMFRTTWKGVEEVSLFPVKYTDEHLKANVSRARFDENVALNIERAKRNGW